MTCCDEMWANCCEHLCDNCGLMTPQPHPTCHVLVLRAKQATLHARNDPTPLPKKLLKGGVWGRDFSVFSCRVQDCFSTSKPFCSKHQGGLWGCFLHFSFNNSLTFGHFHGSGFRPFLSFLGDLHNATCHRSGISSCSSSFTLSSSRGGFDCMLCCVCVGVLCGCYFC